MLTYNLIKFLNELPKSEDESKIFAASQIVDVTGNVVNSFECIAVHSEDGLFLSLVRKDDSTETPINLSSIKASDDVQKIALEMLANHAEQIGAKFKTTVDLGHGKKSDKLRKVRF